MSMVSTQELLLLAGSWLIRRSSRFLPHVCAGVRMAAMLQLVVKCGFSCKLRAEYAPHKQAGSWLSGRSTSELRTEATSSRHQADANTGSDEPCSGAKWREDGVVSGSRNPHGSRQGKPRGTPTMATEPDTSRRCCDHQDPRESMVRMFDVYLVLMNHPMTDTNTSQYHIHPAHAIPVHLSLQT